MNAQPPPRRIAVMAYIGTSGGLEEAALVASALQELGASAAWGTLTDAGLLARLRSGEFDLLITLGGDGSILRGAHLCAPSGLPLLGINMGRFGFLTEVSREQWRSILPALLRGEYRIEERMLLEAEYLRRGMSLGSQLVINEVVLCRGQFVRPVRIQACVNGALLTHYVADGVIASTPTGSTAYALAAGGPIMPPDLRNILIIPVAPHLSMDRAIILAEGAEVELTVYSDHEAVMSVDGQPPIPLLDGDVVHVRASRLTARLIRFRDPGYFYQNITAYMEQNPSAGKH